MSLDLGRPSLKENAPVVAVGGPDGAQGLDPRVIAVVILRDTTHLPEVLGGLRAQRRRPDATFLVDCTGGDELPESTLRQVTRVPANAGTTFNDAVAAALAADEHPENDATWLWLLGDTDRPAMKALAHQLRRVRTSQNVGAVGAKHRGGRDGSELLDVGLAPGPLGARHTLVEPGERDQGQRDDITDVYAAPLSGLLVSRVAWEHLRGLDPALQRHPAGADLDLGRRLRLAGHRVEVAPGAVFTSPPDVTHIEPHRSRAHRRLVWASLPGLPFAALGLLLSGLLAVLISLAGKRPGQGLAVLGGNLTALLRVDQVVRARWRAFRTRTLPRRRLRALQVPVRAATRWHRDRLLGGLPKLESPAGSGRGGRRLLWLVLLLTTVAGLLGLHRLFGEGTLSSAITPDLPTSVLPLGGAALDTWVPTDLGTAGPADPLLGLLTGLGALTGSVRLSAAALVLAALPLAALSAWWAAGGLTRRAPVRATAALLWAASPVLLLGVAGGRLGILVAALGLPVLARLSGQSLSAASARTGWAWAAGAGLVLVPIAAGVPLFAPVALLVFVTSAVRGRRLSQLLIPLPALVTLAPTLWAWWRLFAVGGWQAIWPQPSDPLDTGPAPVWAGLLGWPDATAALLPTAVTQTLAAVPAPAWLPLPLLAQALTWTVGAAPLLLALAVVGTCGRASGRATVLRAGWVLAALGAVLVWAAGLAHVGHQAGRPVAADAYPGTLLIVLGLLVAAVAGLGAPQPAQTSRWAGLRRRGRAVAVAAVCLLPVLGTAAWATQQALHTPAGDLQRDAQHRVPALVTSQTLAADQVRTLIIRAHAGNPQADVPALEVWLVRGDGPRVDRRSAVDDLSDRTNDLGHEALRSAVVRTLSVDDDPRATLADFGVGAVVLLPAADPADTAATDQVAAVLNAREGVTAIGEVDQAPAWRIDPAGRHLPGERPAAVRLLAPDGSWTALPSDNGRVDTTVAGGGELRLAERADPGWRATLNGSPLEPADSGWQQSFTVPTGGELRVWHENRWQTPWLLTTAVVLGCTALLALPVRRPEEAVS